MSLLKKQIIINSYMITVSTIYLLGNNLRMQPTPRFPNEGAIVVCFLTNILLLKVRINTN